MTSFDTDVLVVGSGPAGATAALALATYGVRAVALNKYGSSSPTARAHITNQRTMEILRDFGLEREAMDHATPHELMRDNVYCTSLAGTELGRFEAWHNHPRFKMQHDLVSPSTMVDLTQKLLEPILVTAAAARGATMRTDTELLDLDQDDDGVTATVRDRLTGSGYTIRARYVIGADGGNSRVMQLLGLELVGKQRLGASLGIEFTADLSRYLTHRPGVMYWMVQPTHGILGYSLGSLRLIRAWDQWVAGYGYDPEGPEPELSEEVALGVVRRLIGDDTVPVQIDSIHAWTVNELHAPTIRRDRVFCMGDAVHRHPPMNGLGSNTAVQEGYNLAWKLAMVVRGEAGPALLDSYVQERQPIGQHLVEKVMRNMHTWAPLAKSLGLERHAQSQEELDGQLAAFAAPTAEGARRRADFRDAVDGNLYGFSAIGGEFNHLYSSGAVIPDGRDLSVPDPELEVILGMQSGRRLPHVWLTKQQVRVSSLDLVGHGQFTLLTGHLGGAAWAAAVAASAGDLGVTLAVHVVGPGRQYEDPYGDFAKLCLPDETGAVLVRPDQVVGWHVESLPADPAEALTAALSTLLARTGEVPRTDDADDTDNAARTLSVATTFTTPQPVGTAAGPRARSASR